MCRIPGGVFTKVPESYYVDGNGNVQQYEDFVEWKSQMVTSYIGMISVIKCQLVFLSPK